MYIYDRNSSKNGRFLKPKLAYSGILGVRFVNILFKASFLGFNT